MIKAYCDLHQNLREEGTPIPDADSLVAATAVTHNLKLKTEDQHFKKLEKLGLKLE